MSICANLAFPAPRAKSIPVKPGQEPRETKGDKAESSQPAMGDTGDKGRQKETKGQKSSWPRKMQELRTPKSKDLLGKKRQGSCGHVTGYRGHASGLLRIDRWGGKDAAGFNVQNPREPL